MVKPTEYPLTAIPAVNAPAGCLDADSYSVIFSPTATFTHSGVVSETTFPITVETENIDSTVTSFTIEAKRDSALIASRVVSTGVLICEYDWNTIVEIIPDPILIDSSYTNIVELPTATISSGSCPALGEYVLTD